MKITRKGNELFGANSELGLYAPPAVVNLPSADLFLATPSNLIANNLALPNSTLGLTRDMDDGEIELQYNDLFLQAKSEIFKALKPTTSMALDILGSKLTSSSGGKVAISVSDYQKLRGLKDRDQAKAELHETRRLATSTLITYNSEQLTKKQLTEYRKKGIEAFSVSFVLAKGASLGTDGVFTMIFSPEYTKLALAYPPMLYHRKAAQLNVRKNPSSYYLYRKIVEILNTNRAKSTAADDDISPVVSLSIASLLEAASGVIPTEESVAASNRAFQRRIIQPLERDLDALSEFVDWRYRASAKAGGEALDREAAARLPFPKWKELVVDFFFIGYAEEVERREKQATASRKGISSK